MRRTGSPGAARPARQVIGGRRPCVGTDHRRLGIAEVGADESVGTCQFRRLGGGSRQLRTDRDPRLVDEHLDRRRSGNRSDVELVLQRRHQAFGDRDRISAVELTPSVSGHDDVADAVRREQPPGAQRRRPTATSCSACSMASSAGVCGTVKRSVKSKFAGVDDREGDARARTRGPGTGSTRGSPT